ncbi:MAG: DUF3810 family protein [Acidobacteriota bacterium]|nr:DUF3810 family protein [Acidobacteriota bacterium]
MKQVKQVKQLKPVKPVKPVRPVRQVKRVGLLPVVLLVFTALALWLAPMPPAFIESWYSRGVYLRWQRIATLVSNLIPIALFDLLILLVALGVALAAIRARRERSWTSAVVRVLVITAVVGIWFQLAWGLNYRRVPIRESLSLSVPPAGARGLERFAHAAADAARASAGDLDRGDAFSSSRVMSDLAPAFSRVQQRLRLPVSARPGRAKRSLFDPYFRWAAIDGVTNPLVPETMVVSTLTPAEVHATVAHEWAHLAGYASENEASFVGWLVCLEAGGAARYSGWVFALLKAAGASPANGATWLERAGPVVTADIRAMHARYLGSSPIVRRAASATYDQFLRANSVEGGIRSYDEVLQLMLASGPNPEVLKGSPPNR